MDCLKSVKCLDDIKDLNMLLQNSEDLIIYGAGRYGRIVIDYICRIGYVGKLFKIIVTQKPERKEEYQGIEILGFEEFHKACGDLRKYTFLVAASIQFQTEIVSELAKKGMQTTYCLTCYLAARLENLAKTGIGKTFHGVDFLIAGFCKCGTTTLQRIMEKEPQVFLPAQKETFYYQFRENVDDPMRTLSSIFFADSADRLEGQLVGSIDPTFFGHAKEVYEEFGADVKIVLVLRNPVDAVFSLCKMQIRCGDPFFERYYVKYKEYNDEMFLKYAEYRMSMPYFEFFYEEWVAEYLRYFGKEKLLVLFFEELINDPSKEINRLYQFLGVDSFYQEDILPKANEGNYVLRYKKGYEIAAEKYVYQLYRQHHPDAVYSDEEYMRLLRLETEYQQAEKVYGNTLKKEDRMFLEEKFRNHVRQLESIVGKSLKKLWF